MSKKLLKIYPAFLLGFSLLPLASYGQTIPGVINTAKTTLNLIISLLFVVATLIFLWGVVKFIAAAGDPVGREKSKGIMLWGIIGLAVMAAAWGFANLLISFIFPGGFQQITPIKPPSI